MSVSQLTEDSRCRESIAFKFRGLWIGLPPYEQLCIQDYAAGLGENENKKSMGGGGGVEYVCLRCVGVEFCIIIMADSPDPHAATRTSQLFPLLVWKTIHTPALHRSSQRPERRGPGQRMSCRSWWPRDTTPWWRCWQAAVATCRLCGPCGRPVTPR